MPAPWEWHILSIPLESGPGISAETCGLDDVFPPDDLGCSSYTPFIAYISHIIIALQVMKISACWEKRLVWQWLCVGWYETVVLSCWISNVLFNCVVQDFYIIIWIWVLCVIVHWSTAPHHSLQHWVFFSGIWNQESCIRNNCLFQEQT